MKRWVVTLVVILIVGGAAWLAWHGVRAAGQAALILEDVDGLRGVGDADDLVGSLPELQNRLQDLDTHIDGARAAGRPFLNLAPRLQWLPRIGETIAAAPTLLEVADELVAAARLALLALAPAVDLLEGAGGGNLLPDLTSLLSAATPSFESAARSLENAQTLRAGLSGEYHPRVEGILRQVDDLLPLAEMGLELGRAAPAILGAEVPKTYLILAQNNHELRATGGFISGVGVVRLENGVVTEINVTDSYAVDDLTQPHPQPPASLTAQMGAQILLLRDSNWSPDFPTVSEIARSLMLQDRGVSTDGAIALDLEAVRLLVGAIEPVNVPGMSQPTTRNNVIAQMKQAWEAPATTDSTVQQAGESDWWGKRKDFMGQLVASSLAKLQQGHELNARSLAVAVYQMLSERHLQLVFDDPELAMFVADRGWDGGLRPPDRGDFLAIIDSNVGFNKTNAVVKQEIDYRLEKSGQELLSTATISYTHTAKPFPEDQPCDRTPRYGDSYDELTRRCHYDYLRVYVPAGAELQWSEGINNPATERGERGSTVFAGDFVLRPGDQHQVTLHYTLPADIVGADGAYQLMVRRQAGAPIWPVQITAGDCTYRGKLQTDVTHRCEDFR
jgi:hypothetical protein